MKHVQTLKKELQEGTCSDPHADLNELLLMGPNNIEAIKLKAFLYHYEGRFQEESSAWHKIIEIDPEDRDAISYLRSMKTEDIEYMYFTAEEDDQGRKFFLFPQKLIKASLIGLAGCLIFLGLSYLLEKTPYISDILILSIFLLTVCTPWIFIGLKFLTAIHSITINNQGICFRSRTKKKFIPWNTTKEIQCIHDMNFDSTEFKMVFKDNKDSTNCEIDLGPGSCVRAKTYFIREIMFHFQNVVFQTGSTNIKSELKI